MSQEPAVRTNKKNPPESLRNRWLKTVMLPDATDPRDSCLTELSEYTGGTREEMLSLCESYKDKLRDLWQEHPRDSDEG